MIDNLQCNAMKYDTRNKIKSKYMKNKNFF